MPNYSANTADFNSMPKRRTKLWLLALVLVTWCIYAASLPAPYFTMDDHEVILSNPKITQPTLRSMVQLFVPPLKPVQSFPEFYPVRDLSFALTFYLGLSDAPAQRAVNILLHTINAILIFILLSQLKFSTGIAVSMTAIFLLHPLAVEPVVWVSARKDLLITLMQLVGLILLLNMSDQKHPWRQHHFWGAVVCYALGLLAKGTMIAMWPLSLLMLAWFRRSHWQPRWRLAYLSPFIFLSFTNLAHLLWLRFSHASGVDLQSYGYQFNFWHYLNIQWEHAKLIVYPARLSTYIADDLILNSTTPHILAILGLVLFVMTCLWSYRNNRWLLYGLLWFVLAWLPYANIVANPILMAERYLYLPLIGIWIALAAWVQSWYKSMQPLRQRWVLGLFMVVLTVWASSTYQRAQLWLTPTQYWQDAKQNFPHSIGATLALGHADIRAGQWQNGCKHISTMLETIPKLHPTLQAIVFSTLGDCADRRKQFCDAVEFWTHACRLEPYPIERCVKAIGNWRKLGYPQRAQAILINRKSIFSAEEYQMIETDLDGAIMKQPLCLQHQSVFKKFIEHR